MSPETVARACLAASLLSTCALAAAQSPPVPGPRPAPAQASHTPDAVADPAASVPAVVYRSVFADTPTGVETGDTDWRKANADVGQFRRGHVDILKWESQHEGKH